jgi:L-ascorbate metabolism protein UlaG (beta-lactamase superfamily)
MKKLSSKVPFSPAIINGRFYNFKLNPEVEVPESPFPSIKMYLGSLQNFYETPINLHEWVDPCEPIERSEGPVITWLGHATVLIQVGGLNILADPIFGTPSRIFRRILPFGMEKEDIPPIDVVMLSHNHRDHMDSKTLLYLHENFDPLFLVPQGDKAWFARAKITKVEEFTWWEELEYQGAKFSFVPAWHWSQRGIFDHNKSLWGGWVVQAAGDTFYFAGDTAYNQFYFKTIGEQFPDIGAAIMPIGPGSPDEWMRRSHMSAEEAGKAFLDCKAKIFVPMHWGTFYFGHDKFHSPIERLKTWWKKFLHQVGKGKLSLVKLGQRLHLRGDKNSCSNKRDQNHHKS